MEREKIKAEDKINDIGHCPYTMYTGWWMDESGPWKVGLSEAIRDIIIGQEVGREWLQAEDIESKCHALRDDEIKKKRNVGSIGSTGWWV